MRQHLWDLWGRESIQPPDCKHLCGFFTGVQNWSRLISSAYPLGVLGGQTVRKRRDGRAARKLSRSPADHQGWRPGDRTWDLWLCSINQYRNTQKETATEANTNLGKSSPKYPLPIANLTFLNHLVHYRGTNRKRVTESMTVTL